MQKNSSLRLSQHLKNTYLQFQNYAHKSLYYTFFNLSSIAFFLIIVILLIIEINDFKMFFWKNNINLDNFGEITINGAQDCNINLNEATSFNFQSTILFTYTIHDDQITIYIEKSKIQKKNCTMTLFLDLQKEKQIYINCPSTCYIKGNLAERQQTKVTLYVNLNEGTLELSDIDLESFYGQIKDSSILLNNTHSNYFYLFTNNTDLRYYYDKNYQQTLMVHERNSQMFIPVTNQNKNITVIANYCNIFTDCEYDQLLPSYFNFSNYDHEFFQQKMQSFFDDIIFDSTKYSTINYYKNFAITISGENSSNYNQILLLNNSNFMFQSIQAYQLNDDNFINMSYNYVFNAKIDNSFEITEIDQILEQKQIIQCLQQDCIMKVNKLYQNGEVNQIVEREFGEFFSNQFINIIELYPLKLELLFIKNSVNIGTQQKYNYIKQAYAQKEVLIQKKYLPVNLQSFSWQSEYLSALYFMELQKQVMLEKQDSYSIYIMNNTMFQNNQFNDVFIMAGQQTALEQPQTFFELRLFHTFYFQLWPVLNINNNLNNILIQIIFLLITGLILSILLYYVMKITQKLIFYQNNKYTKQFEFQQNHIKDIKQWNKAILLLFNNFIYLLNLFYDYFCQSKQAKYDQFFGLIFEKVNKESQKYIKHKYEKQTNINLQIINNYYQKYCSIHDYKYDKIQDYLANTIIKKYQYQILQTGEKYDVILGIKVIKDIVINDSQICNNSCLDSLDLFIQLSCHQLKTKNTKYQKFIQKYYAFCERNDLHKLTFNISYISAKYDFSIQQEQGYFLQKMEKVHHKQYFQLKEIFINKKINDNTFFSQLQNKDSNLFQLLKKQIFILINDLLTFPFFNFLIFNSNIYKNNLIYGNFYLITLIRNISQNVLYHILLIIVLITVQLYKIKQNFTKNKIMNKWIIVLNFTYVLFLFFNLAQIIFIILLLFFNFCNHIYNLSFKMYFLDMFIIFYCLYNFFFTIYLLLIYTKVKILKRQIINELHNASMKKMKIYGSIKKKATKILDQNYIDLYSLYDNYYLLGRQKDFSQLTQSQKARALQNSLQQINLGEVDKNAIKIIISSSSNNYQKYNLSKCLLKLLIRELLFSNCQQKIREGDIKFKKLIKLLYLILDHKQKNKKVNQQLIELLSQILNYDQYTKYTNQICNIINDFMTFSSNQDYLFIEKYIFIDQVYVNIINIFRNILLQNYKNKNTQEYYQLKRYCKNFNISILLQRKIQEIQNNELVNFLIKLQFKRNKINVPILKQKLEAKKIQLIYSISAFNKLNQQNIIKKETLQLFSDLTYLQFDYINRINDKITRSDLSPVYKKLMSFAFFLRMVNDPELIYFLDAKEGILKQNHMIKHIIDNYHLQPNHFMGFVYLIKGIFSQYVLIFINWLCEQYELQQNINEILFCHSLLNYTDEKQITFLKKYLDDELITLFLFFKQDYTLAIDTSIINSIIKKLNIYNTQLKNELISHITKKQFELIFELFENEKNKGNYVKYQNSFILIICIFLYKDLPDVIFKRILAILPKQTNKIPFQHFLHKFITFIYQTKNNGAYNSPCQIFKQQQSGNIDLIKLLSVKSDICIIKHIVNLYVSFDIKIQINDRQMDKMLQLQHQIDDEIRKISNILEKYKQWQQIIKNGKLVHKILFPIIQQMTFTITVFSEQMTTKIIQNAISFFLLQLKQNYKIANFNIGDEYFSDNKIQSQKQKKLDQKFIKERQIEVAFTHKNVINFITSLFNTVLQKNPQYLQSYFQNKDISQILLSHYFDQLTKNKQDNLICHIFDHAPNLNMNQKQLLGIMCLLADGSIYELKMVDNFLQNLKIQKQAKWYFLLLLGKKTNTKEMSNYFHQLCKNDKPESLTINDENDNQCIVGSNYFDFYLTNDYDYLQQIDKQENIIKELAYLKKYQYQIQNEGYKINNYFVQQMLQNDHMVNVFKILKINQQEFKCLFKLCVNNYQLLDILELLKKLEISQEAQQQLISLLIIKKKLSHNKDNIYYDILINSPLFSNMEISPDVACIQCLVQKKDYYQLFQFIKKLYPIIKHDKVFKMIFYSLTYHKVSDIMINEQNDTFLKLVNCKSYYKQKIEKIKQLQQRWKFEDKVFTDTIFQIFKTIIFYQIFKVQKYPNINSIIHVCKYFIYKNILRQMKKYQSGNVELYQSYKNNIKNELYSIINNNDMETSFVDVNNKKFIQYYQLINKVNSFPLENKKENQQVFNKMIIVCFIKFLKKQKTKEQLQDHLSKVIQQNLTYTQNISFDNMNQSHVQLIFLNQSNYAYFHKQFIFLLISQIEQNVEHNQIFSYYFLDICCKQMIEKKLKENAKVILFKAMTNFTHFLQSVYWLILPRFNFLFKLFEAYIGEHSKIQNIYNELEIGIQVQLLELIVQSKSQTVYFFAQCYEYNTLVLNQKIDQQTPEFAYKPLSGYSLTSIYDKNVKNIIIKQILDDQKLFKHINNLIFNIVTNQQSYRKISEILDYDGQLVLNQEKGIIKASNAEIRQQINDVILLKNIIQNNYHINKMNIKLIYQNYFESNINNILDLIFFLYRGYDGKIFQQYINKNDQNNILQLILNSDEQIQNLTPCYTSNNSLCNKAITIIQQFHVLQRNYNKDNFLNFFLNLCDKDDEDKTTKLVLMYKLIKIYKKVSSVEICPQKINDKMCIYFQNLFSYIHFTDTVQSDIKNTIFLFTIAYQLKYQKYIDLQLYDNSQQNFLMQILNLDNIQQIKIFNLLHNIYNNSQTFDALKNVYLDFICFNNFNLININIDNTIYLIKYLKCLTSGDYKNTLALLKQLKLKKYYAFLISYLIQTNAIKNIQKQQIDIVNKFIYYSLLCYNFKNNVDNIDQVLMNTLKLEKYNLINTIYQFDIYEFFRHQGESKIQSSYKISGTTQRNTILQSIAVQRNDFDSKKQTEKKWFYYFFHKKKKLYNFSEILNEKEKGILIAINQLHKYINQQSGKSPQMMDILFHIFGQYYKQSKFYFQKVMQEFSIMRASKENKIIAILNFINKYSELNKYPDYQKKDFLTFFKQAINVTKNSDSLLNVYYLYQLLLKKKKISQEVFAQLNSNLQNINIPLLLCIVRNISEKKLAYNQNTYLEQSLHSFFDLVGYLQETKQQICIFINILQNKKSFYHHYIKRNDNPDQLKVTRNYIKNIHQNKYKIIQIDEFLYYDAQLEHFRKQIQKHKKEPSLTHDLFQLLLYDYFKMLTLYVQLDQDVIRQFFCLIYNVKLYRHDINIDSNNFNIDIFKQYDNQIFRKYCKEQLSKILIKSNLETITILGKILKFFSLIIITIILSNYNNIIEQDTLSLLFITTNTLILGYEFYQLVIIALLQLPFDK